jgi:solute carrier family 40 (iron-regulated transporter), member 1
VVVAGNDEAALGAFNAQMHRIDLTCKLVGPFFIAIVDGFSTKAAIMVNLAMNTASIGIEYFAIARVYRDVPELQKPKRAQISDHDLGERPRQADDRAIQLYRQIREGFIKAGTDFLFYFGHRAFLPSIAGALLYLTVLSFAGQMVTYLLSAGYSSAHIGVARTVSVLFEIMATWAAPGLMARIGPIRAGLWFSSCQVLALVSGTLVFWSYMHDPMLSATGLVGGTIISRVGLIGFDLCIQLIVQEVKCSFHGAADMTY